MNAQLSFATVAHFALEGAGNEITTRLTVYTHLAGIAEALRLDGELRTAREAAASIRLVDNCQAEFDNLIRDVMGGTRK